MNNAQFKLVLSFLAFPILFIVLFLVAWLLSGNIGWFGGLDQADRGVIVILLCVATGIHTLGVFGAMDTDAYYKFWADVFNHIDDADRVHGPLP